MTVAITKRPDTHHTKRAKKSRDHSDLPFHQSLEKIKTVAISLQRPQFPRRPIFPPQLFRNQQPPVPRDPLDLCSHPALGFQGHDLVRVQPVAVVHLLQMLVEPGALEAGVEIGKAGEDAGQELFGGEGNGGVESVERG